MGKHKSEEKLRKKIKRLQKRLIRKQKKLNYRKPVEESASSVPETSTVAAAESVEADSAVANVVENHDAVPAETTGEMADSSKDEEETSEAQGSKADTEEIKEQANETILENEKCQKE